MDYGLKSKVAKTRQGSLDEMAGIIKRTGVAACEPTKSFPVLASMISDKDAFVRKSALNTLSEGYVLVGEALWSYVGPLSPKDKTQLEERLRRVAGPSNGETPDSAVSAPPTSSTPGPASRLASGVPRPSSRLSGIGGIPRPASPAVTGPSRLARPSSPSRVLPSGVPSGTSQAGASGPTSKLSKTTAPEVASPRLARPKSFLPSRLGNSRIGGPSFASPSQANGEDNVFNNPAPRPANGEHYRQPSTATIDTIEEQAPVSEEPGGDSVSLTISKILSSDPARSVNALKQIQRILEVSPEDGTSSPAYSELSDHTEGLIETITLQMSHVFENASTIIEPENFRLAKHLIQTINAFCDHPLLAESVQDDNLVGLFEELTHRLLQTDESESSKVKDLSRFINMIILRLFATCRRMAVLRYIFCSLCFR